LFYLNQIKGTIQIEVILQNLLLNLNKKTKVHPMYTNLPEFHFFLEL